MKERHRSHGWVRGMDGLEDTCEIGRCWRENIDDLGKRRASQSRTGPAMIPDEPGTGTGRSEHGTASIGAKHHIGPLLQNDTESVGQVLSGVLHIKHDLR